MSRYLLVLLGLPGLLIAVMAALNVVIDPFDAFRIASIPGFNEIKVQRGGDGGRVAVGFDITRRDYDVLFIGTSRVQTTTPRAIDGLSDHILNGAMPSIDVTEIAREVELAVKNPQLRCIFIGLDYEEMDSSAKTKGTFFLSPLSGSSTAISRLRTALSLATFNRAVETALANISGKASTANEKHLSVEGQRDRFTAMTRDYFAKSRSFAYDTLRMTLLASAIDYAARHGVQVIGFITPIHAWSEETFWQAGHEPDMKRFRRDLTTAFSNDANVAQGLRRASGGPVLKPCVTGALRVLWDFGGYQQLSQTPIPPPSANEMDRFYAETSHYKPEVGVAMVRRMLGLPYELPIPPGDFGTQITAATLDQDLVAIDTRRESWLKSSPDAAALASLVAKWQSHDAEKFQATERYHLTPDDLTDFFKD
jgi:hypothetical protein